MSLIMEAISALRRQPKLKPAPKPLNSHQRCEFVYGGVRCNMKRTTYGKFCTIHKR